MSQVKQDIKILVLESIIDLSTLLNCTLTDKGFHADSCSDINSIEEKVESNEYDVVLLEEGMHDMEDITLIQHVQEVAPSLPIIFIASRSDSYAATGAIILNVFAVLARPFRFHELGMVLLGAKAKRTFGQPHASSDLSSFSVQPASSQALVPQY